MRKNPKPDAQHATLYVGLTAVLNVLWNSSGKFALTGHKTLSEAHGFNPAWSVPSAPQTWESQWLDVESYLETIIPAAQVKYANEEGAVQAAVSSFTAQTRIMLDREVQLHFRDRITRTRILQEINQDIGSAVRAADVPGQPPKSFGGECDLIAVDDKGQLLAIEVKPRAVSSITWAAAQATVYAGLLQRWINQDPDAPTVLRGMLQQRKRLGLVSETGLTLPDRVTVKPVVALQRGYSVQFLDRLFSVQGKLLERQVGGPDLGVYSVSITGRLDCLEPPAAAELV
jgi:hypothetical protein